MSLGREQGVDRRSEHHRAAPLVQGVNNWNWMMGAWKVSHPDGMERDSHSHGPRPHRGLPPGSRLPCLAERDERLAGERISALSY